MSIIKQLAKETVIYGLSSMIGRLLYFFLTPYYTNIFPPNEYGIVTHLFSLTAFLLVFFTYRMETAYFRFATDNTADKETTFATSLWSIVVTTLVLGSILIATSGWIANISTYPDRANLVILAISIIAFDALSEIPYARLRLENKAIRFAGIKIVTILVNIGLNLFFITACPWLLQQSDWSAWHPFIESIYDPNFGIGYIFVANLVASGLGFLLLMPYWGRIKWRFDWQLWKRMINYALPLVVVGLSYVINELFDRQMLPHWSKTPEEGQTQLGIYGANYKLAMLISLFTQAFRYGAEPFFFKQKNDSNAPQIYADVAKYFMIISILGFVGIILYLDITQLFIGPAYRVGLKVVPILLLANIFLGLYYNLSVWYKLTDNTRYGAYISVGGAMLTILLNYLWIPKFGYMGCAWATLICYSLMCLASYFFGQRFYPIPYPIGRIALYLIVSTLIVSCSWWLRTYQDLSFWISIGINSILLLVFLGIIGVLERPLWRQLIKKLK